MRINKFISIYLYIDNVKVKYNYTRAIVVIVLVQCISV